MLAKLNHNKFLLLLLLITASCGQEKIYNTEIFCPNKPSILIKFARAKNVKIGIEKAYFKKKRQGTSENYTVISFSDKSSVKIEKISPEEMIKCVLRESRLGAVDRRYVHHF